MNSMSDYLEKLRECGVETVTDEETHFLRIGRSVYCAASYLNHADEWALVLKPAYRTDWVTATDAGPHPALLPRLYKRAPNRAVFLSPDGRDYFLAGYSNVEQCLWLHPRGIPSVYDASPHFIQMHSA